MSSFVINSSEVAGCIGRNQYVKRHDMILKYLKSYAPKSYLNYSTKSGELAEADRVETVKRKLEMVDNTTARKLCQEVYKTVNKAESLSNYNVQVDQGVSTINEHLDKLSNFTSEEKQILQSEMRKQVFTRIGSKKESSVVNELPNIKLKRGYTSRYVIDGYTPTGQAIPILVGGKVDAFQTLSDGTEIVVEVKNRMRRLFERVVDYEYVQCMCYMYIHQSKKAKLVEKYNSEVREYDIDFTDSKWNDIAKGLYDFAQEVLALAHVHADSDEMELSIDL